MDMVFINLRRYAVTGEALHASLHGIKAVGSRCRHGRNDVMIIVPSWQWTVITSHLGVDKISISARSGLFQPAF